MAVVPETIDGMPVVELGAYTFPANAGQLEDGVWSGQGEMWTENPEVSREQVREVRLPSGLVKIGACAFYNCWNLEELSFSSRTLDWGTGTLTGCIGVRYLDVRVEEGEKSCLKEVLTELRQTSFVDHHGRQKARLMFPESFEESVRNTPTRILEIHMHGCGHQHRYCSRQSEFQFLQYDSLPPNVQAQEDEELVIRLALGRFRFPYGLVEKHRTAYREYLEAHREETVAGAMGRENTEKSRWMTEQLAYNRGELTQVTAMAGKLEDGAMPSYSMDSRHKELDGAGEDRYEMGRPAGKRRLELQK